MKVCTFYSLVFSSVLFSSCGEKTTKEKFDFTAKPVVVEKREVKPLSIGESAPDFNLPGSDGRYYSLSDFDDSDVLAIIFTCNHCPTAQAYEERIKTLVNGYQNQSVQVIGISPNSPLGLLYEELGYSDLGDEFFEMEIRARDHDFNFPYLKADQHPLSPMWFSKSSSGQLQKYKKTRTVPLAFPFMSATCP